MIAKRLRLLVVVTLALSASIWAFGPAAVAQITTPNTGQDVVRVVEGDWQTLSVGEQHWYRFDYAGNNLPVRIALDVNPSAGATFQVWTAAQFSQLATNTGATPVAAGAQDGSDPNLVFWQGSLTEAGPYYVVIQPTGTETTQYLLNIGGRGLAPTPGGGTVNGGAVDGGALVAGAVNVNIRSGPSTAYAVIDTVPQGTELTVLGQDASSTWLLVSLPNGTQGWIARFLTDFGGTVATVPTPELATQQTTQPPLAPPSVVANDAVVVQGTANVNVRSGPSTLYNVLRTVPQGTSLTVLGQDSTGTWLSVQFSDGTQGWIARYLTNYIGTAPVVAAPPLTAPAVTAPPLVAPATTTDGTGGAVVISGAANVNVRTGPSTAYSVIRTVPQGTPLTVLGQDATNSWLWVRFADGTEGWVARFLTNYVGIAPTVTAPALTQPSLAPAPTLDTPRASLYVGPSTAYSIIRDVPTGSQVTILGQESTGQWLWVRLSDGTEGWMARSVTDFTGNAPIVPTPSMDVSAVTQPSLAPPSTVVNVPGISGLPSEPASVHSFPIENALAANWQSLGPGQTRWFTFGSSGDEELIQIWMDVEPNDATVFHVYSESDARSIMAGANPDDFAPIGSGTPNPNESADLFWRGAFAERGTYFVMIHNPGQSEISFSIYGVGPGLGS